jgi:hypothetical protein
MPAHLPKHHAAQASTKRRAPPCARSSFVPRFQIGFRKELSLPTAIIWPTGQPELEAEMNGLIYLVGLIVVILAVLSFFGLR